MIHETRAPECSQSRLKGGVARVCFLDIDIGTSAAKVGLFAGTGALLGMATRSYPTETPRPGWFEQSPELWWEAVRHSIREALERHPGHRPTINPDTVEKCQENLTWQVCSLLGWTREPGDIGRRDGSDP